MSETNKKIEVTDKEKEIEKCSFRIKKDDAEKFKQLAMELGFSQAEVFETLISEYELIKAKSVLSNREKEITAIENHIEGIRSIYLNALEINQNEENMIRENYSKELDSKQETILDLQGKNKELKEEIKTLKNIENSNKELLAATEELKNKILKKEEEINKLNKTNDFFDKLRGEYEEHRDLNVELQKKLKALEEDNTAKTLVVKDLENKLVTLGKEIETTKAFYKNEIGRIVGDNSR